MTLTDGERMILRHAATCDNRSGLLPSGEALDNLVRLGFLERTTTTLGGATIAVCWITEAGRAALAIDGTTPLASTHALWVIW